MNDELQHFGILGMKWGVISVTDYASLQLTGTLHDLLNDHEWQGK